MKIGREIRKIRKDKELTLKTLSELSGITTSGLSQIERGLTNPSLATLAKITEALGVPIISVFAREKEKERHVEEVLVKKEGRSKVVFPDAEITYEPLSPVIHSNIEFLLAHIEEGKGQKSQVTHEGEECVYVIKGRLKVGIENREYIVEEGDSFYFKCTRPHNFMNAGKGTLILVLAVTPPTIYTRVVY